VPIVYLQCGVEDKVQHRAHTSYETAPNWNSPVHCLVYNLNLCLQIPWTLYNDNIKQSYSRIKRVENIKNTNEASPRIWGYILKFCWLLTSLYLVWQRHRVLQKYFIFNSIPVIIQNKITTQIFQDFKNLPSCKSLRIRLYLGTPKCVGVLLPPDYETQRVLQCHVQHMHQHDAFCEHTAFTFMCLKTFSQMVVKG
jgi:hypothetical protein